MNKNKLGFATTMGKGVHLTIGESPVISIEPIGTETQPPVGSTEEGQHYIATVLVGPDKGRQIRLAPEPGAPE
jgi:hypothetical protein